MGLQVIDGVSGDPTFEKVKEVADIMAAASPDWIIACGGGAVIDCAKLAWALYEHPDLDMTAISRPFTLPSLRTKARFAAIPTTSGTGSEVSNVAVVTDETLGRKIPIVSNHFLPDLAILDPSLTAGLPKHLTLHAALDAFTHAAEAYCSTIRNQLAASYAIMAANLIVNHTAQAVSEPDDLDARERLQYGAMFGGIAQSMVSVGASHALSHSLGAIGGVSHGLSNAIFLPPVLHHNAETSPLPAEFASELGFNSLNDLTKWISTLLEAAGVNLSWSEAVTSGRTVDLEEVARAAMEDVCIRTNPRRMTHSDLLNILEVTR